MTPLLHLLFFSRFSRLHVTFLHTPRPSPLTPSPPHYKNLVPLRARRSLDVPSRRRRRRLFSFSSLFFFFFSISLSASGSLDVPSRRRRLHRLKHNRVSLPVQGIHELLGVISAPHLHNAPHLHVRDRRVQPGPLVVNVLNAGALLGEEAGELGDACEERSEELE